MASSGALTASASSDVKYSLQQELRALSQDIRIASKARSKRAYLDRQRQPVRLAPYRERVVAAVYVLSGWDARLAAQKLRTFQVLGSASDTSLQAEREVEELFT